MLVKEKVFERVSDPTVEQMRNALMVYCFIVEKQITVNGIDLELRHVV